jgi:hypothetical protein
MPLSDALDQISRRNHFDAKETAMLRRVVHRVLQHFSADVLERCAVRVIGKGRFLSINAGNILLFRTPGFPDGAKEPTNDVYLIWRDTTRISVFSQTEWRAATRGGGSFAALPHCFDLPLSFEEVLGMTIADWSTFARVCRGAVGVGKSRHWVSNVSLDGMSRREESASKLATAGPA